jgi:heat shock protein HslJ
MLHRTSPISAPVIVLLVVLMLLGTLPVVAQPGSTASPASADSPPSSPMASLAAIEDELVGTWSIVAFDALAQGLVEPRGSSGLVITLQADGELEGRTGCGTYVGSFDVNGDSIGLSVLLRAPEPCSADVSDEALGFTRALNGVRSWRITDAGLELLDESGRVRVSLAPQAVAGPQGEWQVTAFARANGRLRPAPDDGSMHLVIGPGEGLRGGTGCRLFEGASMVQSGQILVVPLDISGLPCEGGARRAERLFLAALERVVLWEREGSELRLTDADGVPLVELTALASDIAATPPDTAPSPGTAPIPSVAPAP